ncbi:hypothetical protein TNCV_3311061 [Trichonephila clavipes]|nr:hypothetical protein TNCV_3311061 [Trichonephila clavipes]
MCNAPFKTKHQEKHYQELVKDIDLSCQDIKKRLLKFCNALREKPTCLEHCQSNLKIDRDVRITHRNRDNCSYKEVTPAQSCDSLAILASLHEILSDNQEVNKQNSFAQQPMRTKVNCAWLSFLDPGYRSAREDVSVRWSGLSKVFPV